MLHNEPEVQSLHSTNTDDAAIQPGLCNQRGSLSATMHEVAVGVTQYTFSAEQQERVLMSSAATRLSCTCVVTSAEQP